MSLLEEAHPKSKKAQPLLPAVVTDVNDLANKLRDHLAPGTRPD